MSTTLTTHDSLGAFVGADPRRELRSEHFADEETLGERLAGWEDVAGTSGSVHWLLRRLGLDDSHLPATAGGGEA